MEVSAPNSSHSMGCVCFCVCLHTYVLIYVCPSLPIDSVNTIDFPGTSVESDNVLL